MQDLPEKDVKDYEFVECYALRGFEGNVSFNSEEVEETAWVTVDELRQHMQRAGNEFTPWFLHEARLLGWIE